MQERAASRPSVSDRPSMPISRPHEVSAIRLSTALLLLSAATVVFTIAIFKLLTFFIMPSLFFDLLFIGFPIGAFLGARFSRLEIRSFARTLWLLFASMILSIGATLACKHFDYLRAHLFEVELDPLIGQMATFTGFFIPFFCAYGWSEYVGYQVGRRLLGGRMSIVYALYLFGAALAYVFVELTLSTIGISRALLIPLLAIGVAALLLAERRSHRIALGLASALLAVVLALPGAADRVFLDLYKGSGHQSTRAYHETGAELAFQRWGRYSLTEILRQPSTGEYVGFYNDLMQWEYSPEYGFVERGLGMLPLYLVPTDSSIAIIGAGGGRQVRWALQPWFDFREILALEVEPAVFEAVRGPLADAFRRVYEDPRVRPIVHEARSYMEKSDETYDLIYLPSVGGYPQMMLEPGNMIRTIDAYATLRRRLSDRGVLAVWYPRGLDPQSVLTRQYVRTLEQPEIGMAVRAHFNRNEFLVLATHPANAAVLDLSPWNRILTDPPTATMRLPPAPEALPAPFLVAPDPSFSPIRDDQPFLAGNVRHIFSLEQVWALFTRVASFLLIAGVIVIFSLRRRGDPRIAGRGYWQVALFSFLIGMNFLIVQRCLILALFRRIYMFHDALVLGAISFLVLSGLGSLWASTRSTPILRLVSAACMVAVLFLHPWLDAGWTLALIAPVAIVTGSFFPALFDRAAGNPLGVFALDALGAASGSIVAFFVPIAFGFDYYFPFAAGVFLATLAANQIFFRGLGPVERPPSREVPV
jgi:hypothetical protein